MLDMKFIREFPNKVQESCDKRGYEINIQSLLSEDAAWRGKKKLIDDLRSKRNKISEQINILKKQGRDSSKEIKEAKEIPELLKQAEAEESQLREAIDNTLQRIPNILDASVPVGEEADYKIVKNKGSKTKKVSWLKPHWEVAEKLDILELERASKLSGSGFYVLKGDLARLQRALVHWMLDTHYKNKFVEINPPQIVRPEILFGTGQLPKFAEDVYQTREGLYLIPTAEVPVTNLYAQEILQEKDLPKKFCAFTQCYRTEAGRHGTVDRGIFRLHEFEKVEMVYLAAQNNSWKLHEEMTQYAEKLLEQLKLPYRKIILASKDTGFSSAKTYDLEVWSPYLQKYLEVSSCSNCLDFQGRRMNTRYQSKDGLQHIHTLNGSGLALPRLMIALLEHYQQKDGSIKIPSVLTKYMHGQKIIKVIKAPKSAKPKKTKKKSKK